MKHRSSCTQNGAYALIIVLFSIALCAVMVVVLLDRGKVGLKSADALTKTRRVRTLSDMVQNIVQAQLRDATTLNQKLDTDIDKRDTWASQPGAIRVYTPTGTLRKIFKLYSAEELTTESTNLAADVPAAWHQDPLHYTDLNAPVTETLSSGTTVLHYPILNPSVSGTTLLPGANGIRDGFAIKNAPLATGSTANTAPMPVRWIYVLQDGTRCDLGDPRINLKTNPIIGRIAFWTDDETTKVNINTASPVSPDAHWDVPRANSGPETNIYAWAQPSQNEYYRYPGHPATVSLRPILGTLGGMDKDNYFALTSRYYWGGSKEGTARVHVERTSLLTMKEDRAYTSVDELLFNSHPISSGTTTVRSAISQDQVSALNFFLTASSRAPELNLFGQPRVSIWPIFGNPASPDPGPTRRTAYDRLLAYNTTLGGKEYYFTRENPLSPTHDYASIDRNKELYSYLQKMTGTHIPGFPGTATFLSKYGDDRDQFLTQIFDYIRITNLNETYTGRDANFKSFTPDAIDIISKDSGYSETAASKGAGFVVPIQIGDTRGAGRFPTILGGGLWFVRHLPAGTRSNATPLREQLSAMLVLKTCNPMHGYMPWIGSNLYIQVANSTVKAKVEGEEPVNLFNDATSKEIFYASTVNFNASSSPGGFQGAAWPLGFNSSHMTTGNTPFFSVPIDIPLTPIAEKFAIEGGSVDIRFIVSGITIQTYRLTFPSVSDLNLPVRDAEDIKYFAAFTGTDILNHSWWKLRWDKGPFGAFPTDHIRALELSHGDARLALMAKTSEGQPFTDFVKHPDYDDTSVSFAHNIRGYHDGFPYMWVGGKGGSYVSGINYLTTTQKSGVVGRTLYWDIRPEITPTITNLRDTWSGDFDNGISRFQNGPFLNKPDEGSYIIASDPTMAEPPYKNTEWHIGNGLFSPLRQVPSPVVLGSLPTGVKANIPWRTFLFCPNPADPGHIGFSDPKDYLLLDLFRMPVVEPFAISSPSTTDGKINMNYAIAPFSYIRRASSFYSLLEAIKLFRAPDTASKFKFDGDSTNYRVAVDVAKTLEQFDTRFAANDIFKSATEICSIFLVPQGQTLAATTNLASGYWSTHRLTGDNSRERPYAELYPKLTTQSNTYRLHMRVQALPPSGGAPANGKDFTPLADYRGSRLIERYLNPNNPELATVDPDESNLNELFQYRALEARQFNP